MRLLSASFFFKSFLASSSRLPNIRMINTNSLTDYLQMDPERLLLQDVYSSTRRHVFSVCTTGGGAQLASWLFTIPGSSRCVMNCEIPYSRHSLAAYLDRNLPQSFWPLPSAPTKHGCTRETVKKMSEAAFRDATSALLSESGDFNDLFNANVFGLACTAALVSSSVSVCMLLVQLEDIIMLCMLLVRFQCLRR